MSSTGSSAGAPRSFRMIDVHTHILPSEIPDLHEKYGYGDWVALQRSSCGCKANMIVGGKFFRAVETNCWNEEARLEDMARDNVHVQVLSTVPVLFSYWAQPEHCLELSILINDHIAGIVKKYPKQFIGLGTIPMQSPTLAVQELHRCHSLGLAGIEIGTHINNMTLGDPELLPVWEAAEKLGMAVFVHPWDMCGQDLMKKYWLPWLVGMPMETSLAICSMIFSGVFERFPNLRVCFAHGGGSFPATLGRVEHGWRVRPDLVAVDNEANPRDYMGKFYLDALTHDARMLKYVTDLIGVDKVCLGTDYPFPLGELSPGKLITEHDEYTDEEKQQMLWKSAFEWLGVDPEKYSYV